MPRRQQQVHRGYQRIRPLFNGAISPWPVIREEPRRRTEAAFRFLRVDVLEVDAVKSDRAIDGSFLDCPLLKPAAWDTASPVGFRDAANASENWGSYLL